MIFSPDSLPADGSYYFLRYECCIPVKGYTRSLICDTQRGDLHLIPIVLFELLEQTNTHTINEIKSQYDDQYGPIIQEYFDFLISKELGCYCDEEELQLFPPMSMEWKSPCTITNAIVDYAEGASEYDIAAVATQLSDLKCQAVELRFFKLHDFSHLRTAVQCFDGTEIAALQIVCPYNRNWEEQYQELLHDFPRIQHIYIHSANTDKTVDRQLIFSKKPVQSEAHCGLVDPIFFNPSLDLITESLHYNSCLNRKVAVDKNGEIKNCPSMTKSYGNVRQRQLKSAIQTAAFQQVWAITKDKIDKCRDCEFRYVCTDCRAFLEEPDNEYSKPLKCGYDPYAGVWQDWSINPLKQKAIRYYGLQEHIAVANL
ncbi:MAG: grasp-with-spasm system SPASM domain peptide maturase [Bacteroidota bacterium]